MSRRKQPQEESYETADGFQIEDMEGNLVEDESPEDEAEEKSAVKINNFWEDDEDDEHEEKESNDYFDSVAENSNWEEGYDY